MQKKVKTAILAMTLVGASALLTGYGNKTADAVTPLAQPQPIAQEKSEKQKAFEEQVAKEKAAFDKRYNEAKRKNDEIRKKFDEL